MPAAETRTRVMHRADLNRRFMIRGRPLGAAALPFVAEDAHRDLVDVGAVHPVVLPEPPLLDEAGGQVASNRALVVTARRQRDLVEVPDSEGVLNHQPDRLAAIAPAPALPIADGDAKIASLGGLRIAPQAARSDELAFRLDAEVYAVGLLLTEMFVVPLFPGLLGPGLGRIAAGQQLDLHVLAVREDRGKIRLRQRSQRHPRTLQHRAPPSSGGLDAVSHSVYNDSCLRTRHR